MDIRWGETVNPTLESLLSNLRHVPENKPSSTDCRPKECSSVCRGEIWAIHADPPPGSQPNTDTIRNIFHGLCVRTEKPAAVKKTQRKESVAELSGRREAATCFSHYSGRGLNGSLPPVDIVRLWNVIQDAGGGSLEKAWALSGRRITELCHICCSVISPIDHCLLRSATEPPGGKLYQPHVRAAEINPHFINQRAGPRGAAGRRQTFRIYRIFTTKWATIKHLYIISRVQNSWRVSHQDFEVWFDQIWSTAIKQRILIGVQKNVTSPLWTTGIKTETCDQLNCLRWTSRLAVRIWRRKYILWPLRIQPGDPTQVPVSHCCLLVVFWSLNVISITFFGRQFFKTIYPQSFWKSWNKSIAFLKNIMVVN